MNGTATDVAWNTSVLMVVIAKERMQIFLSVVFVATDKY